MSTRACFAGLMVTLLLFADGARGGESEPECPLVYRHANAMFESLDSLRVRIDEKRPLGTYEARRLQGETELVRLFGQCVLRNLRSEGAELTSQLDDSIACAKGLVPFFERELEDIQQSVSPRTAGNLAIERLGRLWSEQFGTPDGNVIGMCFLEETPPLDADTFRAVAVEVLSLVSYGAAQSTLLREYWKALVLDLRSRDTARCIDSCQRLRWLRLIASSLGDH